MVSLIRKILSHQEDRFWFAGFIVIAANSGGAWSPIGDVTTTMLWIEHKVSTLQLIKFLIIPSILSIAIPIGIVRFNKRFQQNVELPEKPKELASLASKVFLFLGIGLLILVPIIKALTHLPPFIGMMGALAVIWLISELDLPSLYPPQKDFLNLPLEMHFLELKFQVFYFSWNIIGNFCFGSNRPAKSTS